jgi:hypothetical protein
MSIRVMTRVWDTAQAEGGALLVLLALADYADDDGYAYPKEAQIASKARLSDRQVRTVIKTLAQRGELAYQTSQGRNTRSWYVVLSGLDDTTKAERISGLAERNNRKIFPDVSSGKSRENRKFATPKTGSLTQGKPEVCDISRGGLARPDEQNGTPNRHGDPSYDPSPPPATPSAGGGGGPENPSRHPAEDPETKRLLVAAGVRSPNALRRLAHLTPDIVRRFVSEAQASRNAGPGLLVSLLDAYLETGELPATAPVQRVAPVAALLPEAPPLSAEERHRILARYGRAS